MVAGQDTGEQGKRGAGVLLHRSNTNGKEARMDTVKLVGGLLRLQSCRLQRLLYRGIVMFGKHGTPSEGYVCPEIGMREIDLSGSVLTFLDAGSSCGGCTEEIGDVGFGRGVDTSVPMSMCTDICLGCPMSCMTCFTDSTRCGGSRMQ